MSKVKNYNKELFNYATKLDKEYKELSHKESQIDCTINDILHYIEFNNFNACQGYKLANMLKQYRIERREIKCEKQQIDILLSNTLKSISSESVKKRFNDIEVSSYCSKKYKPKVLVELFKRGVK